MKKFSKIFGAAFCLCLSLALLTGCGSKKSEEKKEDKTSNKTEEKQEEKSKGNCSVFECIKQLDPEGKLEDANKIIGFEGTVKTDAETYIVYEWKLTSDTSVTINFMKKYDNATIDIDFPDSMINEKADFSKWNDMKSKISKGTFTYDEFVESVGGVQGTLTKKSKSSETYRWVNSNNGYLSASFDSKNKKCSFASGRM